MKTVCGLMAAMSVPALSGCSAIDSPGGRIGLLVLLPLLFVGFLLWAIRQQRKGRLPDRKDKRGYPDYDDRD